MSIHGPLPGDAKLYDQAPETLNDVVRKTLEKLGPYKMSENSNSNDCHTFGPHVFIIIK